MLQELELFVGHVPLEKLICLPVLPAAIESHCRITCQYFMSTNTVEPHLYVQKGLFNMQIKGTGISIYIMEITVLQR